MSGEVVYEVNLQVAPAIAADYRKWLAEHVREILALPGFISAEILSVEADAESGSDWQCWSVCYRLHDRRALQQYFEQHAARLRAAGVERFGSQFRASRRILHREPLSVPEA
ncbi:DUF4286 family protein [Pseudomarimonas arenosa]|uniref:DUF4286 family protein n=1 Tax=Pseudomarimonas arenosa TaxID=2774145 RepID=A0AAW3ZP55_9GAMM|nr:DUF4286 family protein [Pseudomarimonas arenosa]MBD8527743.1 DUF4286 family protein [Pseudomarimonas arenosa]